MRLRAAVTLTFLATVTVAVLLPASAQAATRSWPHRSWRWHTRSAGLVLPQLRRAAFIGPVPVVTPVAPSAAWPQGGSLDGWVNAFNGYGSIQREPAGGIVLSPRASGRPGETHSALATTTASFGDVDVTTTMTTERQLRTGGAANPWEVGWLIWHYSDNSHFYYLSLKPNGLELGKEDPAYPGAQRFLVTQSQPAFPVGSSHLVRVTQVGPVTTVWVDGSLRTSFVDEQRPYTAGHVGVYCEDSTARFSAPVISSLS